MFKFNFSQPYSEDCEKSALSTEDNYHCSTGQDDDHKMLELGHQDAGFKKHCITSEYFDDVCFTSSMAPLCKYEMKSDEKEIVKEIYYLSNQVVEKLIQDKSSEDANALSNVIQHSDLNSGVYEGGFKVWECSIDLIDFLQESSLVLYEKDVLELGCGAGLPGIHCMLSGSRFICYQDFNKEVIDMFTIPNVLCNTLKAKGIELQKGLQKTDMVLSEILQKNQFLSGNWDSGFHYFKDNSMMFDVILTSETIYNPAYYAGFHEIMCSCLKKDGFALVASKTYYFGVGGSTKDFIDFVNGKGRFRINTVATIIGGVNREILKLEWK